MGTSFYSGSGQTPEDTADIEALKEQAEAARDEAVAAQNAAESSETDAAASSVSAANSAYNSAASASASSASAATSAAEAAGSATSASAASTSASSAATSATNAATSADNAFSSATHAAASASSASSAQTAAEVARDSAQAAFDDFDDTYLGSKTSDPTTDNDGDALVTGALYYNSTTGNMMVYDGSAWVAAYVSLSGAALQANNLSDLSDASTARTNLGVEIGTDVQAYSSVLAATTASYTTAEETKLAGIEAGATADQTKADIDALGINADLLDGQHGSYYTAYADTAVANLVDSAPGTLNTLNELAAALGDDPNFATTVTNSIATKLPLAGGTMTGNLDVGGNIQASGFIDGEVTRIKAWDVRSSSQVPNSTGASDYMPAPSDEWLDKSTRTIFSQDGGGSSWSGILTTKAWNGTTYGGWQLSGTAGTTPWDDLYFRDGVGGSWGAWRKLWHSGNDSTLFKTTGGGLTGQLDMNNNNIVGVNSIVHEGDTNTYMRFPAADEWDVVAGNARMARVRGGQEVVLSAGESGGYATGQTGENVYLNSEYGVVISSSPDNWASGWAGRNTTTIGKSDGGSDFGGNITIYGGSNSKITFDQASNSVYDAVIENAYDWDGWLRFRDGAGDVRFWFGRDDQVYTGTTQQNRLMRANGDTMSGTLNMGQNDITNGNTIYMDNWYRSTGNTGWYNETYGGGIHMTDTTYVRVYNSKKFYVSNTGSDAIYSNGGVKANGYVTSNDFQNRNSDMRFRDLANGVICYFDESADTWLWRPNGSTERMRLSNGTMKVTGNIQYTGTITDVSDDRLKENKVQITGALDAIKSLTGYTYNMVYEDDNQTEMGLIAQDVQAVLPVAVKNIKIDTDGDGTDEDYLGVSYIQLIAPMIEAIKEQQQQIEALEARISTLETTGG